MTCSRIKHLERPFIAKPVPALATGALIPTMSVRLVDLTGSMAPITGSSRAFDVTNTDPPFYRWLGRRVPAG